MLCLTFFKNSLWLLWSIDSTGNKLKHEHLIDQTSNDDGLIWTGKSRGGEQNSMTIRWGGRKRKEVQGVQILV